MAKDNKHLIFPRTDDPHSVHLKNVITRPDILVGDYTIYNDPHGDPRDFEKKNVLYPAIRGEKIVIGRYCSIGLTSGSAKRSLH